MKTVSAEEARRGFRIHAFAFVVGIIAMFIINYTTGPQYWWALWVLLGWGIGIIAHWWFVLGPGAPAQSGTTPDRLG